MVFTSTVEELARNCNLKTDDLLCLLDALGVLSHRRLQEPIDESSDNEHRNATTTTQTKSISAAKALAAKLHLVDWTGMQVALDFELIVKIVGTWRIPAKPLLDPECCWIEYTGGPLEHPASKKTWVGYM